MEKTIALALNKFPSVPLTFRETPTNDVARKEVQINLADLFHHYYQDLYGRSPPNPDPAQFEHLRFLVPEEGFRMQGDGIGVSTAVRRNRSTELGQAFCRWFLHQHLNMTYFAHMKQALDGQLHPAYFAHHLERTQKGDTPDYFCARNANDVFLAEAKGGYEAAGFGSKKFASWRTQFDRVVVKDDAGNPRRIKGFIVSTRFSTEESGPGVKSTLLAEDPETRGISELGEEERQQLGKVVVSSHYSGIAQKLNQPILAAALSNGFVVPDEILFQVVAWKIQVGPYQGRRFIGGYFPAHFGALPFRLADGKIARDDLDVLRLDVGRGTFFGVEENILGRLQRLPAGRAIWRPRLISSTSLNRSTARSVFFETVRLSAHSNFLPR